MRSEIERYLTHRKSSGIRDYYDCPFCTIKDCREQLVVTWDQEQYICNHGDSCGASGHISQLAKHFNIKTNRDNYYRPAPRKEEPRIAYSVAPVEVAPVIVEQPEVPQIDMEARIRQLECLFYPEENLCVAENQNYFKLIMSNRIILENEVKNYTHFKTNPGGTKDVECTRFTHTLIECDDGELSWQRQMLEGLKLPITTLVYSGNKSLHALVRIDAPNLEEFRKRVRFIHGVCTSVGFKVDTSTTDPSRFTRLAGAIHPKTGHMQSLIGTYLGAKSWDDWINNALPTLETAENTISTASFESRAVVPGFSSGFLTHDYNDSGLKAGGLTILTGRRNQGKTTFARQIMIATAKQELKVFAYMGEGEKEREKGYLERLVANDGELIAYDNTFGRTDWYANEAAAARYNEEIAPYIDFYDKPLKMEQKLFAGLMSEMIIKAKQGTVLFVLDNMMKLTCDEKETFKAQQQIIAGLKEFAVSYQVHIILIAHPRKDGTSVSGAMEIENTADTILKFTRLFGGNFESDDLPIQESQKITAMVLNEKVRDGGKSYPLYMEFDGIRQANIEVVYLPDLYQKAVEYKRDGFFSREMIMV